jgi:hypothetical protein
MRQNQADDCPHCGGTFQIVRVKFGLRGASTESVCPNCAIASEAPKFANRSSRIGRRFRRGLARVGSLNLRTRRVVAVVIGAVIVAAALRHGFHVYGGYSRSEIAEGALIALPAALLIFLALRKR